MSKNSSGKFFSSSFALHFAVESGNLKELSRLLKAGKRSPDFSPDEPNEEGRTILHVACAKGFLSTVKELVEEGANVNAVDLQGMTPLRIALRTCQFEIAEFLYHKDAKLAVTEGITNTSTLLYAGSHGPIKELSLETASDYEKHLSLVDKIIQKGVDINEKDGLGNTILHYAVESNNAQLVNLLLSHKADPNISNSAGDSSLHLAVKKGSRDIVVFLLEHGAQPEQIGSQRCDSIQLAQNAQREDIVDLFLRPPASIDSGAANKSTPVVGAPMGAEKKKSMPSGSVIFASRAASSAAKAQAKSLEADRKGTLKKKKIGEGGKINIKLWQRRFCVLKGSTLCTYKSSASTAPTCEADISKASLKVSAPYHRVVGLPPAAPEGQPYCFTVECEEAKDNETENANDTNISGPQITKVGRRNLQFVFAASSEEELLGWVDAIQKARNQTREGVDNKWTDPSYQAKITMYIKALVKFLESEENLRLPELWNDKKANQSQLLALRDALEKLDSKTMELEKIGHFNGHSVFHFLASLLSEMPIPLLTFKYVASFFTAVRVLDPVERLERYKNTLNLDIPIENINRLRCLLPYFRQLEQLRWHNGMTYHKIAILFGYSFIRGRTARSEDEINRDRTLVCELVEDFVKYQNKLFDSEEDKTDQWSTRLEEDFEHFQRRIGTDGLLFLLDQEVEAVKQRWESVKEMGRRNAGGKEWEPTSNAISELEERMKNDKIAMLEMKKNIERVLEESRALIDATEPSWNFTDDCPV